MSNFDLLNFRFVDRDRESAIIDNFLHSSTDEILWVLGDSGVGKSFFLQQTIFKKSIGNVIICKVCEKPLCPHLFLDIPMHNIFQLFLIHF